jgi:CheY-like chemotaxis protein
MAWRVLVADDDPEICTLIKTILARGPYDVTLCEDAESALVHIQRDEPYDILISDFMMPGISGIELITQLRQNRPTSQMPIVMISGHNNYAMDARAKEAGANAFLNKPFAPLVLRTTVHQLLTDPLQSALGA